VKLTRVEGQPQIQALAWSRRPMRFSASAVSITFDASRFSSRDHLPISSIARSIASASLRATMSCRAAQPQLRVLVALHGGQQERALELAALVEVQHRPGAPPTARFTRAPAERSPLDLLAVVEVLDGDPPQLALEDLDPPRFLATTGITRRSTRTLRPVAAAAHAARRRSRRAGYTSRSGATMQGDDRGRRAWGRRMERSRRRSPDSLPGWCGA